MDNEKGITLLEVLLSMVLLSIVLLTIVNVFPQMGRMNVYNGEKMKAVNIARAELAEWKDNGSLEIPPPPYKKEAGPEPNTFFYYTAAIDGFNLHVMINKQSDLDAIGSPSPTKAHSIQVQVLEGQKVVSETYGYMMVNE